MKTIVVHLHMDNPSWTRLEAKERAWCMCKVLHLPEVPVVGDFLEIGVLVGKTVSKLGVPVDHRRISEVGPTSVYANLHRFLKSEATVEDLKETLMSEGWSVCS